MEEINIGVEIGGKNSTKIEDNIVLLPWGSFLKCESEDINSSIIFF